MKKLLSMIGVVALIGTTSTNVIACGLDNTTPPTPDIRTDLSTIITNTSLDKIKMVGTVPTKQELLQAIKSKNVSANTLSENDFDFENSPTATTATIEGKTNYKGKVTLTYEKDTRTDLSTIISTTNLDKIYVGQLEKPNKDQILEAIKNKNTSASTLTANDFDFENSPTATTATIEGKTNYKGKVILNFTISMFKNINNSGIPQDFTIESILKINNLIYVSTNGKDNKNVYKSNGTDAFTALTGTSGAIYSLTVDSKNNVYAGSNNGTVYKSNGTDAFTALTGTSGTILSLTVDSKNNVYAGSNNGTVYKSNGTDAFTALTETSGTILSLTVDSKNNVYAGSNNGTVYKSNGTDAFTALTGTSGTIYSLTTDKDGNLYAAGRADEKPSIFISERL